MPSNNTFLTRLTSINIGSREFPNALAKMLASRAGVDATVTLQGDDTLTLVDVLGRGSKQDAQEIVDMLDLVRQLENEYLG